MVNAFTVLFKKPKHKFINIVTKFLRGLMILAFTFRSIFYLPSLRVHMWLENGDRSPLWQYGLSSWPSNICRKKLSFSHKIALTPLLYALHSAWIFSWVSKIYIPIPLPASHCHFYTILKAVLKINFWDLN